MKPETRKFLDKAHGDLADARMVAAVELSHIAARSAYYAAFHAAEAFIFERTGKVAKTHSGVRSEFTRLARFSPEIGKTFSAFLAEAYKFKEVSDYSVGSDSECDGRLGRQRHIECRALCRQHRRNAGEWKLAADRVILSTKSQSTAAESPQ